MESSEFGASHAARGPFDKGFKDTGNNGQGQPREIPFQWLSKEVVKHGQGMVTFVGRDA